jgi:hypothetical protein
LLCPHGLRAPRPRALRALRALRPPRPSRPSGPAPFGPGVLRALRSSGPALSAPAVSTSTILPPVASVPHANIRRPFFLDPRAQGPNSAGPEQRRARTAQGPNSAGPEQRRARTAQGPNIARPEHRKARTAQGPKGAAADLWVGATTTRTDPALQLAPNRV